MKTKISALIFSMNNIDRVLELSNHIKNYVDEIVVVDSSTKNNFETLKRKLKFAKIIWLPPIGMADLYYSIGLELATHDWVFHLDDDEIPSKNLLQDLKQLIKEYGGDYPVFKVKRINVVRKGLAQKLFRIFNKEYIIPTGVIHWTWVSKTNKILDLEKISNEYYILHYENVLSDWKANLKRLWKYSIIESYQYGYKVLSTIYSRDKFFKYQQADSKAYRLFKELYENCKKINKKFALLVATTLYNLYFLQYGLFKIKKVPIQSILYSIFIQINLLRNFSKKYKVWVRTYEKDNPIRYMHLNSLESFKEVMEKVKLDEKNGLKNFIKIVEYLVENER